VAFHTWILGVGYWLLGVRSTLLSGILLLLLSATLAHGADVQMAVEATPRQVFLGESLKLTVKVSGLRNAPEPDLSALPNCSYVLQGSQDQNYQNVTIINGRMQRTGFSGRIFTYALTPTATGTLALSPIRLAHGGQVFHTGGPTISVVGVEEQDDVLMRLSVSRNRVIVDEAFDVTLSISIQRLPGTYATVDPFDISDPPELTIPYLQMNTIPGLDGEDVQALLQSMLSPGRRVAGFGINGLTIRGDPLNSFFRFESMGGESRASFRLPRSAETINGTSYLTYTLRTRYIPKQEKTHTFGPVSFKGGIFTTVNAAGQATQHRIFATAPAITLRVTPPPLAGRPTSYVGAIGSNMLVEAALDTQTCNVGDPLRLTLTIRGTMSVDNLSAPILSRQNNVTEAFRVYDDTIESETLSDGKRFTYTIRPIKAGTLEFPALDVAYYDSNTRRYEIVKSTPIPIVAYQADEVKESFIVAATNTTSEAKANTDEGGLIVAPITLRPEGSEPAPPWLEPWQWVMLLAGPILFGLVGMGRFVRLRLTTTADSRRRKAAMSEALRLVERAERQSSRSAGEARTLLLAGIRKYLANRWGGSEGGITPPDAARLLREHKVDAELSRALVDVLDRSFHAEYDPSAASAQNVHADAQTARGALRQLEKWVLTLMLLLSTAAVARADGVRNWFLWEEANTRMATATAPQDYLAAAETYRELYAMGVENGPLLYNMGTAFLMAGHYENAHRALQAAEIHEGTTPAIERNMILSRMADSPDADALLPWYRLPLFWHYGLPLRVRIAVALLALSAAWGIGLLRWVGWRRGWHEMLGLVFVVAIIVGSSALASLHELTRVRSDLTLLSYQQPVELEDGP